MRKLKQNNPGEEMKMLEKHKQLEKLVKTGYKNTEIKYSGFKIYAKGNLRVIYDFNNDKIIHKYLHKDLLKESKK